MRFMADFLVVRACISIIVMYISRWTLKCLGPKQSGKELPECYALVLLYYANADPSSLL